MKQFQVIILFSLVMIWKVSGKPNLPKHNHVEHIRQTQSNDTETPVETKPIIMLPKNTFKFVVTEKPTSQPLESLYKFYVGKKPVMRKFVPTTTAKANTEQIAIIRRPLMKQRKFVIDSIIPKRQPLNKDDLFSNRRRKLLNPIIVKVNSTVLKDSPVVKGDDYDGYASNDMMVSGSIKVYRKIMGELPKNFMVKPDEHAEKKNTVAKVARKNSSKVQNDVVNETPLETPEEVLVTSGKGIKSTDEDNEDADKVEFIFVLAPPIVAPKDEDEDRGISTVDGLNDDEISSTEPQQEEE